MFLYVVSCLFLGEINIFLFFFMGLVLGVNFLIKKLLNELNLFIFFFVMVILILNFFMKLGILLVFNFVL